MGFLHNSLIQCGLCLSEMTLISLSLARSDIFRSSTQFPRSRMMLSVSKDFVAQHLLTFSALIVYLRFHMLVSSAPSICQYKINELIVHGKLLETVLSKRSGFLVYHQIARSMVNSQ